MLRFPCKYIPSRFLSSCKIMDRSDLIKSVLAVIPPLTFSSHKGESGRIGVIGGCREYTGAPYFAAISALKVGCDLSHVFCTQEASPVIKSYSPELIVHPILDSSSVCEDFSAVLPRLHAIVIGPGLGRDSKILETVRKLIDAIKKCNIPIVLDADALFYVTQNPSVIAGYKNAILTPNIAEFRRLCGVVLGKESFESINIAARQLSIDLGFVTVAVKGFEDVISDGVNTVICKEPGSPRRCGGQGDLLSGSMGVFSYWAHKYYNQSEGSNEIKCSPTIISSLAACMLARKCSYLAFQKYKRSTTTTDMISEIRTAFTLLFPVD